MKANELLNRLTYLVLTGGSWDEENLFTGTREDWQKVQWADDGVPSYALKQGRELLTNF